MKKDQSIVSHGETKKGKPSTTTAFREREICSLISYQKANYAVK